MNVTVISVVMGLMLTYWALSLVSALLATPSTLNSNNVLVSTFVQSCMNHANNIVCQANNVTLSAFLKMDVLPCLLFKWPFRLVPRLRHSSLAVGAWL